MLKNAIPTILVIAPLLSCVFWQEGSKPTPSIDREHALPTQRVSIRQVDFKNFAYPFGESDPDVKWEQFISAKTQVQLTNGRINFPEGGYLDFEAVTYGDLDDDGREEAAVHLHYGTGGSQTWDYLYVFRERGEHPELISRFVSGSRADGGLIRTNIHSNRLLLDLQDGERRIADCCSLGLMRLTYRLESGSFREIAPRIRDSFRIRPFPTYVGKPNTVEPSREGGIVYIDAQGTSHRVTATSEKDSAPSASFDKTSVVFVRNKTEVWTIRIDGSNPRKAFSCVTRENLWSCDVPQFSPDGRYIYVIREVVREQGGVWRIDLSNGSAVPIIADCAQFLVIAKGPSRGSLIANQRTVSRDLSSEPYPKYPFFMFSAEGTNVRRVGEDDEDIFDLAQRLER